MNYLTCITLLIALICVGCKPKSTSSQSTDPDQAKPYLGLVEVIFINAQSEEPMPHNSIKNATLIRYAHESKDPEVDIKRWSGDKGSVHNYVELESRDVLFSDHPGMKMLIRTGIYQIKHNSVTGTPPSGYYGESAFFEIKAGDEPIEVKIVLYPAI